MTPALSAAWNKAKAEKRMAGPVPDYPPILDLSKQLGWVLIGNRDGEWHEMGIFHSPLRRDSLLVMVDGRIWKRKIGRHQLGLKIGDSLGRLYAPI